MSNTNMQRLFDIDESLRFKTDYLLASQSECVETKIIQSLPHDSALAVAQHGIVTHIHRIRGVINGQEYYKYLLTCPSLEAVSRKLDSLVLMYDLVLESELPPSIKTHAKKRPHRKVMKREYCDDVGQVASVESLNRFVEALRFCRLATPAEVEQEKERAQRALPKTLKKLYKLPSYTTPDVAT